MITTKVLGVLGVGFSLVLGTSGLAAQQAAARPEAAPAAATRTVSFVSGGIHREYLVHEPAKSPRAPRAAILIFHGGGGTPHQMQVATGFDGLSDRYGFVAVYPTGVERSWNDGRGADTKAGVRGVDDVAFVSALIDKLVAENNVDRNRVYATGLSNGGMFTHRLGCALSSKIAGIAPVAGSMPVGAMAACATAKAMPVLTIHGTADQIVPYEGGVVRSTSGRNGGAGTSPVLSVELTQQFWRTRNACLGPVLRGNAAQPIAAGAVTSETAVCPNGNAVQLYAVIGGRHVWPSPTASDVIWQFFSGRTS